MAPPPAKRLKRSIILSSNDDKKNEKQLKNRNEISGSTHHSAQNINNNTVQQSIPTRSRTDVGNTGVDNQERPLAASKGSAQRSAIEQAVKVRKPILTIFNAASRSQPPVDQNQAWRTDFEVDVEGEDLIEEDSPTGGTNFLRQTRDNRKSALDTQKKRLSPTQNPASTGQKKLPKTFNWFKIPDSTWSSGSAIHLSHTPDLRPWAEKYAPISVEELAVHKKKVVDVRGWLDNALHGRDQKRLLILRGPSGSGKTATISTLAQSMGFDLLEWRNPVGSEYASEGYSSMSAQFDDFLGRSCRFNKLATSDSSGNASAILPPTADAACETTKGRVLLIEEYPDTFFCKSNVLRSFRSSVLEYLAFGTSSSEAFSSGSLSIGRNILPMVMIISESRLTTSTDASDSFTAHRLLGSEVLSHPAVSVIEFNPIACSFLKKALELVIQKEAKQSGRRRIPGTSILHKLGEVGDVRSAIGSLEFLCLRAENGDDWGGRVAFKAKKDANCLTKMEKESLEMVTQRESRLGLFHGVAKVVYNKRNASDTHLATDNFRPTSDRLPEHTTSRTSQVSVNQLIDEMDTDLETFIAALHENYVLSCEGNSFSNNLNGCLDALSDSDVLTFMSVGKTMDSRVSPFRGTTSDHMKQDEIRFQLTVRGLLFALPDPVKRRSHPVSGNVGSKNDLYKMFYPASMRMPRQIEELTDSVDRWVCRRRAELVSLGRLDGHIVSHSPPTLTGSRRFPQSSVQGTNRPAFTCPKAQLILEDLPFISIIERRNPVRDHHHEIDQITKMSGQQVPNNEASDNEDETWISTPTGWTASRSSEKTPVNSTLPVGLRKEFRQGDQGSYNNQLPISEYVLNLYLSDDDILDD